MPGCYLSVSPDKFRVMTTTSTTQATRRPRKPARTRRGKRILAAIDRQGLTLHEAADKAGISFNALQRVIHEDAGWLQVRTVVAVCLRLGLPLELVAPPMAKLPQVAPVVAESSTDSGEALPAV